MHLENFDGVEAGFGSVQDPWLQLDLCQVQSWPDELDDPIEQEWQNNPEWQQVKSFCAQQLAHEPEDEFEMNNPDEYQPPKDLWQGWRLPEHDQSTCQQLDLQYQLDWLQRSVDEFDHYGMDCSFEELKLRQLTYGPKILSLIDQQQFGWYLVDHAVITEDEGLETLDLEFLASSKQEALLQLALYYRQGPQRLAQILDIQLARACQPVFVPNEALMAEGKLRAEQAEYDRLVGLFWEIGF